MSTSSTKQAASTVTKANKAGTKPVKGGKPANGVKKGLGKAVQAETKPVASRDWHQSAKPANGLTMPGSTKLVIQATENPYADVDNRKHVGKRPYWVALKGCKSVADYLKACERAKLENGMAALVRMANYGVVTIG